MNPMNTNGYPNNIFSQVETLYIVTYMIDHPRLLETGDLAWIVNITQGFGSFLEMLGGRLKQVGQPVLLAE